MGSLRFPGFGERLTAALLAAGYVKPSGQPDIPAFLAAHGFDPRSFYPWVRGTRTPELDTLTQLAGILGVSRAWLLLGDGTGPQASAPRRRKPVPSGGGATVLSPPAPRGAAAGREVLCQLLRDWFPSRWGWLDGSPTWCPA